jgi:hypothetical protein
VFVTSNRCIPVKSVRAKYGRALSVLDYTEFSVVPCAVRALRDLRCFINETPNNCRSVYLLTNALCSDREVFVCLLPVVVVATIRDTRVPALCRPGEPCRERKGRAKNTNHNRRICHRPLIVPNLNLCAKRLRYNNKVY